MVGTIVTQDCTNWPKCWCGRLLIEHTTEGFPLGFLNCPTHEADYEAHHNPDNNVDIVDTKE